MGFSTPKKPFDLKEFMENSIKKGPARQRSYSSKRFAAKKPKEAGPSDAGKDEK